MSERIKRMFMMLPFVPETLINREIVDDILRLWEAEFPGTVGVFDTFRNYILNMYIGPTASYKPHIWSVSGMRIRTNNAAESLHGRLNILCDVTGRFRATSSFLPFKRRWQTHLATFAGGARSTQSPCTQGATVSLPSNLMSF